MCSKNKKILCSGISLRRNFEGGAGLGRNNGCIQSIFNKKPQSSTTAGLSWLLIQIVTWLGDFGHFGACGVRSNPGLPHDEEISVIVRNKFCNGRVFVVY